MVSTSTAQTHDRAAHSRQIAIALAFAGTLPTPLPLTWLHKFYLGQYLWGVVYLILAPTLIPQLACCLEGIWYLTQSNETFCQRFPASLPLAIPSIAAPNIDGVIHRTEQNKQDIEKATVQTATAIRELEQLRQDGLITENEFEQKRRKLLDCV